MCDCKMALMPAVRLHLTGEFSWAYYFILTYFHGLIYEEIIVQTSTNAADFLQHMLPSNKYLPFQGFFLN